MVTSANYLLSDLYVSDDIYSPGGGLEDDVGRGSSDESDGEGEEDKREAEPEPHAGEGNPDTTLNHFNLIVGCIPCII